MFVHVLVLGVARIKKIFGHPLFISTLYISTYEPGLFDSLVL